MTIDLLIATTKRKTSQFARINLGALQTPRQQGFFEGEWVLRSAKRSVIKVPVGKPPVPAKEQVQLPKVAANPSTGNGEFIVAMPDTRPFNGTLEGTRWQASDSQEDSYKLFFLAEGELYYDAGRGLRKNGTWELKGSTVSISIYDGYATLTGQLTGRRMSGKGRSRTNNSWTWSAEPE